jgi:hypothetical protein
MGHPVARLDRGRRMRRRRGLIAQRRRLQKAAACTVVAIAPAKSGLEAAEPPAKGERGEGDRSRECGGYPPHSRETR